ncbi:hypothetical protein SDC9_118965 [bioreactor metagenome]|uniref:Uncharacterized protein n=1 Tax=bioreactor metagenome TaxID=1076179 RepID=A0A645C2W4_9ZZZZ
MLEGEGVLQGEAALGSKDLQGIPLDLTDEGLAISVADDDVACYLPADHQRDDYITGRKEGTDRKARFIGVHMNDG